MPGVQCLGDVLSHSGYYLSYIGGADLRLVGKGTFYRSHGFAERKVYAELADHLDDASDICSCGLYDDTLLDIAFKKFILEG